ncbi:GH23778 [Drosophila grimshawi]|uniref:GH23778 n=1 Tax=Drosophila grimshawi TaxID=7222 RepID=B4K061_DROGR|nr:GH23778 [Drosophila grimshawi]
MEKITTASSITMEHQTTSVDVSGSASGRRRASDTNLFGRPSEAGVPCDEGAGPRARAVSGRRPQRPLGRRVRLVRVVRVERRRVLRRIAQEQRNRQSDELELLASPLQEEEEEEQREDGGEAQGQGERPQIPPPTVTATYARAFADGHWRHQVTLVCVWEEEAGLPPTWQLEEEHPPADPRDHHHPRRRSGDPHSCARRRAPRRDPDPPDRRFSDKARLRKERLDGRSCHRRLGLTAMADAQPGPSREHPGSCGRRGTAIE